MKTLISLSFILISFPVLCPAQKNPSTLDPKRSKPESGIPRDHQQPPTTRERIPDIVSYIVESPETPVKIIGQPRASRPPNSGMICTQGSVLLKVELLPDGTVGKISVVRGLPHGFNEQAVLAARKITFVPAKQGGVAIAKSKVFEYRFGIY